MLTDKIQQKTRSMPKGVLSPSSASSPGSALHHSTPTTVQRTRTSLRVTDKITPPHMSVEDSAYASMAAPTAHTPKLIHGEKVSGINEDDLSETYI